MPRYVVLLVLVIFPAVPLPGECLPVFEERDSVETAIHFQHDTEGINHVHERSPTYMPVHLLPPSEYGYTNNGPVVGVSPWVVIHTCWKPYASFSDISSAIKNALVVPGLTISDMKEALDLRLAVVTVRDEKNTLYSLDGYSSGLEDNGDISYFNIRDVAVSTILESSSFTHLAWMWASFVWGYVKQEVQDVSCLTVVLELLLARQQVNSPYQRKLPGNAQYGASVIPQEMRAYSYQQGQTNLTTMIHPPPPNTAPVPPTTEKPKGLLVGVDLIAPPLAPGSITGNNQVVPKEAMYNKHLFEGDITDGIGLAMDKNLDRLVYVGRKAQGSSNVASDGIKEDENWKFWPNGILFFEFHSSVSSEHQTLILRTMAEMSKLICITFRQRDGDSSIVSYVIIRSDLSGCNSAMGMNVQGSQQLSLGNNCMAQSVIMHELLHALGFAHEHSRSDRDNFIKLQLQFLQEKQMEFAFNKRTDDVNFGTAYDIRSLMHYDVGAFAFPNTQTIVPIGIYSDIDPKEVGGRNTLGPEDINMINRAYGCSQVTFRASTSGDGARWQFDCDWNWSDIVGVPSSGEECGQKCRDRQECSHFTWSANTGTCWLKRDCPAPPFVISKDFRAVCGYLPDRVKAVSGCTRNFGR